MSNLNKRYDFVLLFDVKDGNPNGDPDAANLPRIDAETGTGLVTDVCLKRKVRNFIQIVKNCDRPYDIYIKEKAVLGQAHFQAFKELNISTGEISKKYISDPLLNENLSELSLSFPEGLRFEEGDENGILIVDSDADKKVIKEWIKENNNSISKEAKKAIDDAVKEAKPRKPTADETNKGKEKMCQDFYDIRTFGAVMSLKSAPNCGQVRGPVQLTFARSVEPIVALEHSITRMAVATEAEAEKQSGDNRTMGRKYTVPYGLYRAHGFVSAHLANQTGFSEEDLNLFWDSLLNMFEHDRSAARGMMATRGLYVFEHSTALGNTPAYSLFDRITVERKNGLSGPARSFDDYVVNVNDNDLGEVNLIRKLG